MRRPGALARAAAQLALATLLVAAVLGDAAGRPSATKVKRADLAARSPSASPAQVAPGAALTARTTTRNRGRKRARASRTGLLFSADRRRSRDDLLLPGSQAVPALRPRRFKRGRVTLTIPSSTPAGSFHLLACADLANKVKEASERNNCRASRSKVQVSAGAPGGGPQGTPAGPGAGGGGVPLTPPAAPTGLTAATVSSTQIDLAWNASAGATSYRVLRSDTPGGPYAEVASPSGPAYSDSGRTADTAYHYVVRAANAAGESPDSAQASATTLPDPPPAPASLTATAVSASQINLTWPAASGATSYRVFRSTTSGSGFTEIATPATNSHSDTGRSSETTYFYLVQAVNTGGSSGNSPQASATTHFACSTTGDPGFGSASFLGSISGDTGNGVVTSTGEACTPGTPSGAGSR